MSGLFVVHYEQIKYKVEKGIAVYNIIPAVSTGFPEVFFFMK